MKETLFLPSTPFPLKGGTQTFTDDYVEQDSNQSFILHDGPPYANGSIHMGHALNKILKDIILREKRRNNISASFVPSWDCHGLPIESKFKSRMSDYKDVPDFLSSLSEYASSWVDTQDAEFKQLNVSYSDEKIKTSDPSNQKIIMKQFHDILLQGKVYQKYKPVYWPPVEQTVMADAETDDVVKSVSQILCLFPANDNLYFAVWTTTPWSLVGNVGVAFNNNIEYGVYQVNDKLVICSKELSSSLPNSIFSRDISTAEIAKLNLLHPFHNDGYPLVVDKCVIVHHDFVKNTVGTGFVHLGPAHSQDDFMVWEEYFPKSEFPNPVNQYGKYDNVPLFNDAFVVKKGEFGDASELVINKLKEYDLLLWKKDQELTVKKSWRSNGLLVTRATSQWFIDIKSAKEKALLLVDNDSIKFIPERSKNRFRSMLEVRPDWLVSRQRLWGVPLGIFQHKVSGLPLLDSNLCEVVQNHGVNAWYTMTTADYFSLANRNDSHEYEKVDGVLDVWFDSSCVQDMNKQREADLYLEGSDQHRGWFSSSLLKGILTDNVPFKTVLTHGFVVDESKFKMSKSANNGMSPSDIQKKYNSDIIRLWVATVDYTNDISISDEILKNISSLYDKLRNPFRYMTGVLLHYPVYDNVNTTDIHSSVVEEYLEMKSKYTLLMNDYDISKALKIFREYLEYISSTYFDIHKDLLYCQKGDQEWHMYRSVVMYLYDELSNLIKPVLPSLVNELHSVLSPIQVNVDISSSGHWVKNFVTEARANLKELHSGKTDSLIFEVILDKEVSEEKLKKWLMVSQVIKSNKWSINQTSKYKCNRCWRYDSIHENMLCNRCESVMEGYYETS